MRTIHHKLLTLSFEHATGASFEHFAQAFFAAMLGRDFVPVGGVHDGGADGILMPGLYASSKPKEFLQATVQEDYKAKVKQTVARLREVGREPETLIYATADIIQNPDAVESELSSETGCMVRIRDAKYFSTQINTATPYVQAWESYLAPALDYLRDIGAASTITKPAAGLPARALCVFIGQEIERRSSNSELLESLTDTLILWSLRDTDPAKGVFRTKSEILDDVISSLPAAKQFIRSTLDARLRALASKANTGGRAVTHWKKEDKYCLPFETRELIKEENADDEALKLAVAQQMLRRLESDPSSSNSKIKSDKLVQTCFRAFEKIFELQGLEVSYFLSNVADQEVRIVVDEVITAAISELNFPPAQVQEGRERIRRVLQGAFYDSTECERTFLAKLSRTYCLLFSLKNEPRVVEYFRGMSSNFILYVGSDLIVRALSEHYLAKEDRMTENLFEILQAAGSSLIFTEATLDEVYTHLKATDHEYRNNYQLIEPSIDADFARHIPKILLRAYFYAKLDTTRARRPSSWNKFIEQFCSYDKLHKEAGRESIRTYIMEKFGCEYEPREETRKGIDTEAVEQITVELAKLRGEKEGRVIRSRNDAEQVLRVYERRRQLGEGTRPNPFGYRTWWMTQETTVRRATKELVRAKGSQYIVRPEFLLNFIALNPKADEVRRSFEAIFPSLLGVRLANRMKASDFNGIIGRVRDAYDVSEARARAQLPELVDQLKAELHKQYDQEFEDEDIA